MCNSYKELEVLPIEPEDIIYYNNKSGSVGIFDDKINIILLDIRDNIDYSHGNIIKSLYLIL